MPKQNNNQPNEDSSPRIWQILFIAVIAIIFSAVWLSGYNILDKFIWSNSFVTAHHWVVPLGVLFFSLLVGLLQKYLHAPTMINHNIKESFVGAKNLNITNFPGAILSSYASLLSGASVGPEGPLGILVQDIAIWFQKKFKLSQNQAASFMLAAMSSAYNGIIGSPIFTALFGTELQVGGNTGLSNIIWSLLAGVIGYAIYTSLHLHIFAQYIPFTPISSLKVEYFFYAIVLGLVGAFLAILVGFIFRFFGTVMGRLSNRIIERNLITGVIIAIAVYFFPQVMFAGETQIFPMIHNPAAYGVMLLLWFALLKLLLLGLSLKSGYLGGPTFPILFAATMVGLAFHLIFPSIPMSILVLCIEAGTFALVLNAPLTAILVVAVIGTADPYTTALLVLSTTTSIVAGNAIKQAMTKRAKNRATSHPSAKHASAVSP